ncbi:MAG: hypothetical protein A2156_10360 [Deltaproteobacteria bacterium RBG_16_48_10]|nr:MAG: hypothetical protein A2156_10360 [Deltaproteobacteria bacterium RBG_16_48_10]
MKAKYLKEERGIALIISMMMLLTLTFLGMSAVMTSTYDTRISGNVRASEQAFNVTDAGINEFLGRFRWGATNEIQDLDPENPNWELFLAIDASKAQTIGYSAGDNFIQSLQNQLDFRVKITHKVDLANNVIFHLNSPIYIAKSYGFTADGAKRIIEAEITRPEFDPPAALYTEQPVNIQGNSTYIQGTDTCGTKNKPGIAVTLPQTPTDPITTSGNPTIQGNPAKKYNSKNADLKGMVDILKNSAQFSYDYNTNKTLSGQEWGTPTGSGTTSPLTFNGPMNIVYFDMHGDKRLTLSGGSGGAGILLVNGDLELNGGFKWYGVIIVMGSMDYTGGGQKNVTGGVWAAETATVQIDIGGNAGIMYCSEAVNKLRAKLPTSRMTKWRDVF